MSRLAARVEKAHLYYLGPASGAVTVALSTLRLVGIVTMPWWLVLAPAWVVGLEMYLAVAAYLLYSHLT